MLAIAKIYSIQFLSVLRKHLVIGHFNLSSIFLSAFHWLPSIGKLYMIQVSDVRTTESCKISLVTINRQTSYDSGSPSGGAFTETDRNGRLTYSIGPDCAERA